MKKLSRKLGYSAVAFLASVGVASAAVPAGVTSALDTASSDGVTIAGVVLGVIVAIAAFKYIRRAL